MQKSQFDLFLKKASSDMSREAIQKIINPVRTWVSPSSNFENVVFNVFHLKKSALRKLLLQEMSRQNLRASAPCRAKMCWENDSETKATSP